MPPALAPVMMSQMIRRSTWVPMRSSMAFHTGSLSPSGTARPACLASLAFSSFHNSLVTPCM